MYKDIYENWLAQEILTEEQRKELLDLKENEKDIEFRFGKFLEFGTAGMRGTIGMGTNMINVYTVRRVTQGLAEYIKSLGKKFMERGVVISYDTRKFSELFARTTAGVLLKNGIKVFVGTGSSQEFDLKKQAEFLCLMQKLNLKEANCMTYKQQQGLIENE